MANTNIGKLLIVDDEVELKNILVEALASQGYQTSGFISGEEALAALRKEAFDVLFTDLMMPGMDGIALVTEALKIDPHLVAIVMTGQGTIQTAVDAMKVGAFDYVLKPFRLQTVMPVLTRAMNTRRVRLENLQLRETVAIYELSQTIAFTLDRQTIISKLADAALEQTDADEVSILFPTEDGEELYVAAVRGANRQRLLGERVSLRDTISSWVVHERTPLILDGEINDERFRSLWPRPEICSAISIPMQIANKLVGTININALDRARPFTLGQMKALTILASTAAAALESASLYGQVQRAEENYRSIFQNAVEGIFQSTPEGQFITVNPAMARILGYDSPEQMIESITDAVQQLYVNPADRVVATRLQQERGTIIGFEFQAIRKDGQTIWLSLNRRSVYDDNGRELYREGTIEDITERKQAEEALKSSEAEVRALFAAITDVIVVFDANGRYLKIAPTNSAYAHKPPDNLIGKTQHDVFPQATADFLVGEIRRSLEEGRAQRVEYSLQLEGTEVWFDGSVAPLSKDSVIWIARDITERKRADEERELLASEIEKQRQRLDSIVGSVPGVVWEAWGQPDAATQRINFVSDYVETMLGYTVEEWLSTPNFWLQIVHPDDRERTAEASGSAFVAGANSTMEFRWMTKDGRAMWVEANSAVIKDDRGNPVGLRGVTTDISARKRADERQARRAAHALFRADVSAALAVSRAPLRATLELCTQSTVQHLQAAFARIWTLNSEEDVLELQASAGMYTHIDGGHARVPMGKFKIGKIAEERAPHITNEVLTDPHVGDKEWAAREGMVAFAGYPLVVEDRLLGVMALFSRSELPDDTIDALASVADIISQGIERKRAEAELRQSEERYRDLVENAKDIIYSHDLKGNYISTNKAGEETTGYTLEESLRLNLRDTVAPEYLEKARDMLARKLAGETVTAYELELIRKDGRRVPVEVNTRLVMTDGIPVGVQGIARDISERKRAEAELRRLAAAVEQTGDSVIITDPDGNIEYANPAFERITGYSREEVLGQNPRLLKSGKTDAAVYRDLWQKISRGEVWVGLLINRKKDGTLFTERATISAVLDDAGKIAQYVAVKQDTTHAMQLEDQLRQAQKMEAIGQLAGGVAHDFNNLLTAINGYTSLALQKLDDENSVKPYLEEVKKAGERATNLTRQLLAFGRKQILQPVALDLNSVVTDMNKMLRRLIGEDIELRAQLASDLKRTKGDPGQIEQVLVNLVVNARDAMPRGGMMTIGTANVQLDQEYARNHVGILAGNYVMLAVSDTGCGMDEKTRARIFEPFFTTKEKGKGTGLGLSMVYGIVKQSGGSIWVYSEPDKGTSFKVYLPELTEDSRVAEKTASPEETIAGGKETVLLVEDEEIVRGLTTKILQQAGYTVVAARGGDEALQLCTELKQKIDLLLTDVVMPGASGKEVAETMTRLMPGIRVLFMSGYTDEAIVHHGVLDSNVEFIQKPFTPFSLSKKVREVLDLQPAGR